MSRIGKQPIQLLDTVKVQIAGDNTVTVKGPQGELSLTCDPELTVKAEGGVLTVDRPGDAREQRAIHGLTRSLLANMVEGVTNGFSKRLQLNGVGYRAEMTGDALTLRVGFSHPVRIEPPAGISFEVPDATSVVVRGSDKQLVGQIAADIRAVRPVEPYQGRGIRYSDEQVRRKAGKARAGDS
jgi:large subunit ribosomal protein L6